MELDVKGQKITVEEKFLKESSNQIRSQLKEYLNSERTDFKLNVNYPDNFTGAVMRELSKISYGETQTYGEIAQKLDNSPIAIGQACGRNPVPVIVPCHRVVGKTSLGGYRYGESVKKKLLNLEEANLDN